MSLYRLLAPCVLYFGVVLTILYDTGRTYYMNRPNIYTTGFK